MIAMMGSPECCTSYKKTPLQIQGSVLDAVEAAILPLVIRFESDRSVASTV
jgi:hypothetical protein